MTSVRVFKVLVVILLQPNELYDLTKSVIIYFFSQSVVRITVILQKCFLKHNLALACSTKRKLKNSVTVG
jgi:hypothetical protein